jgi:glycosyltransferase involved in cell wall biosynthesis
MLTPYISCVIPSYNAAAFLSEALESALHQDFPESEREIIVVDDASTDGTPGVLRRYAGKIRVLRHAVNRGQGEALRTAVRAARGEVIAALDADDVWLPKKLSRVAKIFDDRRKAVAVSHECRYVGASLRPIAGRFEPPYLDKIRIVDLDRESVVQYHECGGRILLYNTGSTYSLRKSAVLGNLDGCRPPAVFADGFFILMALASGGEAVLLGETLSLYRRHEGSVTARLKTSKPFMDMHLAALKTIDAAGRPLLARDVRALLSLWTARALLLKAHSAAKARRAS